LKVLIYNNVYVIFIDGYEANTHIKSESIKGATYFVSCLYELFVEVKNQ